jgi:hypothetical protein
LILVSPAIEHVRADAKIISDLSGGFVAFQAQLDSVDFELLAVLTA